MPKDTPDYTPKKIKGIFIILLSITITLAINVVLVASDRDTGLVAEVTPGESAAETDEPSYTLVEVAERNSAEDCWMAAYGNVYDLTPYVAGDRHPGGQGSLVSGCGEEATDTFDRIHSDRARDMLEDYRIGVLEE